MRRLPPTLPGALGVALALFAAGASAQSPSRGELLYSTHCITCHSTQMHWRDQRAVTDWSSLKAQVRRWQGAASLAWSEADVTEVARYLNDSIYHFESTADVPVTSAPVAATGPGDAQNRK